MDTTKIETNVGSIDAAVEPAKKHIRGSSLLLAGRIIAMGINFAVQVMTVRYLSKSDFGAFAYALSVVSTAAMVILFGLDKAIVRFVPIYHEQKDYRRMFGTIVVVFGTVVGLGAALILLLFAFQGLLTGTVVNDPLAVSLLLVLIALSPLEALDSVFQGLLAVFARPKAIFFRRHLLGPSLKLAAVLIVFLTKSSVLWLAFGYLIGGLLGIAVYVAMFVRLLKQLGLREHFSLKNLKIPGAEVFKFSVPLLSSDFVAIVRTTIVVVLLEYFGNTTSVADFRAVVPVAGLNLLVLQSFKFLYTPMAARMFARNDSQGINDLYWQTAIWIAVLSFPIFVISFSLAQPLTVLLFEGRYAQSGIILALLSLGNYFNAALGFNTYTLRVYGKVGYIVLIDFLTALFGLGLSFVLIPRYGALGGAISVSSTLILYNILNHTGLLLGTGIDLFQLRYMRVYASIIVSAAALLIIQEVFNPHILISAVLVAIASVVLVRFNRSVLDVVQMFPELKKLPLIRPLFGL